ncbi:hypothetical protein NPIL_270191 [Nephila pilipes]|uniref:Uncharacterized protein n=1 Tax=Nephila pilipes TaxID=299642 RepID=A0A8X6JI98_NEPPI|nr:hypothetical protein NPIL_270191 [Nephila pilipes]
MWGKRSRLNDIEAPRQSSYRGPVACFWSTNRKQNTLLWAPKNYRAHRQLPTSPNDEQNEGADSEKRDSEEVKSNNESNHDRESEEDKDRPERFIDLDVERLKDIALWPTTLTDLMID